MKVAIIGAGLAGLSCAIVLEQNGIIPTLYEKRDFIGDREPHVGASLNIVDRPITDALKYIKKNFNIDIEPLGKVNKLSHYAPTKSTIITGNFGYLFRRDKEENSFKGQLFSQLKKTKVVFNTEADYKKLSQEYDFVVLADGKPNMSEELGCWTDWIHGFIKGAKVYGDFDPNELIMWLDRSYCKNGYAYLTAFDSKMASLALFVPNVSVDQVDYFWDKFLLYADIKYEIIETFKVKHGSGLVTPYQVDNILLAGNAGGAIDPFLGFGQVKSVTMGGMAARAILEEKNYKKLIKDVTAQNIRLYELRKAYDNATNNHYDLMVSSIGLPGFKPTIYDTPINAVKYGSLALKLKRKIKGEKL